MEEGSPLTRKNTGYDRISWGQINGLGASPEGASVSYPSSTVLYAILIMRDDDRMPWTTGHP